MKKSIYLVVAFFVFAITNAQIYVRDLSSNNKDFKDNSISDKFKASTTIFILSDIYTKEQYDEILKKSWTVTPYIIISYKDFDVQKYLSDKYSFGVLNAYAVNKGSLFYLHSSISFYMYNMDEISKDIDKVKSKAKDKNRDEKVNELIEKNIVNIANIELFCNTEMLKFTDTDYQSGETSESYFDGQNSFFNRTVTKFSALNASILNDYEKKMLELTFKKKTFKNYTLGMLFNYFQQVSSKLSKSEKCSMYDIGVTIEVKKLKSETIYIPDYNKIAYKATKIKDEPRDDKDLKKLFDDYKYKYAFISENDLDQKILNGENIYYLRYVKMNNNKFFEVVNSKTGNIIYKYYEAGLGTYNIDENDFKKLSKEIAK